jgi:hypothetical protein
MSEEEQEKSNDELLQGDVETMESHKRKDKNLAKNQRDGVFTKR